MITIVTRPIQFMLDIFYPLFKKLLPYQLYAYLAVGAVNTALNIILFAIFYQFVLPKPGVMIFGYLVESYTISLLTAFLITIPTGFWLSKNFAFPNGGNIQKRDTGQMIKYFLVVSQGLIFDYLILKAQIVFFNVPPTVAKVVSTMVVLTLTFILQKYFTFKVKVAKS